MSRSDSHSLKWGKIPLGSGHKQRAYGYEYQAKRIGQRYWGGTKGQAHHYSRLLDKIAEQEEDEPCNDIAPTADSHYIRTVKFRAG